MRTYVYTTFRVFCTFFQAGAGTSNFFWVDVAHSNHSLAGSGRKQAHELAPVAPCAPDSETRPSPRRVVEVGVEYLCACTCVCVCVCVCVRARAFVFVFVFVFVCACLSSCVFRRMTGETTEEKSHLLLEGGSLDLQQLAPWCAPRTCVCLNAHASHTQSESAGEMTGRERRYAERSLQARKDRSNADLHIHSQRTSDKRQKSRREESTRVGRVSILQDWVLSTAHPHL